jgi:hypothetical protein
MRLRPQQMSGDNKKINEHSLISFHLIPPPSPLQCELMDAILYAEKINQLIVKEQQVVTHYRDGTVEYD